MRLGRLHSARPQVLDRRFKQLRRDALPALIGRDDEAHDRADVARGLAGDALELRLRRGMAPADYSTNAVGDQADRLGGAQELAARGAVLLLGPGRVVVDEAIHAETPGPVGVVRVRDHVEVVHDSVMLIWRDRTDRDFAHIRSLSHQLREKRDSTAAQVELRPSLGGSLALVVAVSL